MNLFALLDWTVHLPMPVALAAVAVLGYLVGRRRSPGAESVEMQNRRELKRAQHVARELDHKALRELKRRALHYQLDTRRPEIIRTQASGGPGRRPSLAETVRDHLQRRVMPGDIDRDRLVALGLDYLREAETLGDGISLAGANASTPGASSTNAPKSARRTTRPG